SRGVSQARQSAPTQPRQCLGRNRPPARGQRPRQSICRKLHGIGYNAGVVRQRLGPNVRIDSWDWVFRPELIAKFQSCGIHMLDSSDDILAAALHYLKRDPNSKEAADLESAAALITKIRPNIRKFHSSEYLNALAAGEICFVVGFSGDVKQAGNRA